MFMYFQNQKTRYVLKCRNIIFNWHRAEGNRNRFRYTSEFNFDFGNYKLFRTNNIPDDL